jgi:hypothetical protein
MIFASFIDAVLGWIKWPVAIVAVVVLPSCVITTWGVIANIIERPGAVTYFLAGGGGYVIVWLLVFRNASWGTWFSTLEHELTHVLFALLTLHRVTGLNATFNQGGAMSYAGGKGNWLITISPYFFPTFSVLLAVLLGLIDPGNVKLANGLLGVTLAYHAISSLGDFHREQTDLQEVGFPFSWIFLPSANLMTYAAILAFAHGGGSWTFTYLDAVFGNTAELAERLLG